MSRPMVTLSAAVVLGGLWAGAAPSRPAAQQRPATTLFSGARLITEGDRPPIENSAFLVEGDKITRVGRRGEIQAPGAAQVDLTGKTVIPALVNAHGHLGYQKDLSFAKENYTRENIVNQLKQYTYYGVGAMMTTGTDAGDITFDLREHPEPEAALVRTAGRGFAAPNAGPGAAAMRDAPYGVTTEDQARADVRELAAKKPDFIKFWEDDRGGTVQKLAPNLYRAIIDEAHKNGIRVIAHEFYLADARDMVDAGVDGFLHSVRDEEMDDALIAKMKQRNVFLTPNLGITQRTFPAGAPAWFDDPLLAEVYSPAVILRVRTAAQSRAPNAGAAGASSYEKQIRSLSKLNKAGVTIALGDDSGIQDNFSGYVELQQLEAMAEAGMTPQQVLVAATRTSAGLLRLNDMGSIAAGKSASFVVLDANPLDNLANVRKISKVYLRGQEINRAALKAQWSGKP